MIVCIKNNNLLLYIYIYILLKILVWKNSISQPPFTSFLNHEWILYIIYMIIFFYWFPSKWEGIGKIWCPPTFSCFFPYVSKIKPWDKLFWTAFFHLEWFHYYFYVSNTYMIVWFCFQKVYLYQVFNFFLIFAI